MRTFPSPTAGYRLAAFRGPADQMHGDTFNKLVRTSAEELMEALFDSSNAGPRMAPGQGPSVIKTTSAGAGYVPLL